MKLKSFNFLIGLLLILYFSPLFSEEKIDIWKNNKDNKNSTVKTEEQSFQENSKPDSLQTLKSLEKIKIEEGSTIEINEQQVFGIYEPASYNLNLNMWSNTKAEDLRSSLKRLNKIKFSNSSNEILEAILFSFSYPPQGMTEDEFVDIKINWLMKNDRVDLIEKFLKQNDQFQNKSKAVQHLVDYNIASGDIKKGCEKIKFIDAKIKDSYLEKFKIYCLIFNNKKNEAQLIFDLLKEQKLSDSFFNNKINFLLGISEKADNKIKDNNLLNFYLSSITVPNFKYEPNEKTNKYIWEYLNAANLVTIEDFEDRDKIKTLETAANNNKFDKDKLFEIYKKIPFDVNSLVNAQGLYQSLDEVDSRALIFQKYLLSDNPENKIKLLLLLQDISKRANLSNIFREFISDNLKEIADEEDENLVKEYEAVFKKNIITERSKLGKVKFDDKILHRSRVIRFYTDINTPAQKTQKDLNNVYKKIRKNKKYFFSAKDLALIESLKTDGFSIPEEIKTNEIAKQYSVPKNLLDLAENDETGLLALKFVEIIGEDEISILDPETIYFITNILNKAKLIKFRNKVLVSALPLRS